MEEPCLVKFPEKKPGRPDYFSFRHEGFTGRLRADVLEIVNHVFGPWNFERHKVSAIKRSEETTVHRADGLDGPDTRRSDLLCEGQFLE